MMLVPTCDPLELRSMYQRVEGLADRLTLFWFFSLSWMPLDNWLIWQLDVLYSFFYSDSEDSDGEGGLGNVSRVIIRPPGHSGKAKRGHLCFDAAFETGNLGRADLVGEFEYDLFLRPDTCNPRYRFWFNFTVDNVKLDQVWKYLIWNFRSSVSHTNLLHSSLDL